MTKRVLITGGFGYLGGRIAVALASKPGWSVRLGSRKARPSPGWLPHAETVAMNLLETGSVAAAMANTQAVVHLAAMNENDCLADPCGAVVVNTVGTLNALQAAVDAGVERFIYFSTARVYGEPLAGEITEQTLPRPIHPYAITHHAAEGFVMAAHDQKKIQAIVVRLSNGFGAPTHPDVDRWTLIVNDLCRQAAQTRKLTLRSSGIQQRNFITLTDVGRAVGHLLELRYSEYGNGLFNLGGGDSISILDIAQIISQRCQITLGFTPAIEKPAPRPDERFYSFSYNSNKLRNTGFHLTGNLAEEIDNTLLLCKETFA